MASKYGWSVTHSQEDVTAERCNGIPGFLHESPVSCTLPSLEVVLGIRDNFGLTYHGDFFFSYLLRFIFLIIAVVKNCIN